MILPVLTETLEYNNSIFDCVSTKTEIVEEPQTSGTLDYMVTVYPRNENISNFNFVYSLFDYSPHAFNHNQQEVIILATELFSGSKSLGEFESQILNGTFKRLAKKTSTLSGRK
jgi:hypothetical protein